MTWLHKHTPTLLTLGPRWVNFHIYWYNKKIIIIIIIITWKTTVLAGFTFLALPASPDPFCYLNMSSRVQVVLTAGCTVQQVF